MREEMGGNNRGGKESGRKGRQDGKGVQRRRELQQEWQEMEWKGSYYGQKTLKMKYEQIRILSAPVATLFTDDGEI